MGFIKQPIETREPEIESNHSDEDLIDAGYPVKKHPSWDLYDTTKVKTFSECERKYFYEYILGWRPKQASIHLVFGEAVHLALEHAIVHGWTARAKRGAVEKAEAHYRKYFPPELDEQNFPKVPSMIVDMLELYQYHYSEDRLQVEKTEISGVVPLSEDRALLFRIDAIASRDGIYYVLEHKTGSRLSKTWTDQWMLSEQVGTYTHALYCMYEHQKVGGVIINGLIFKKSGVDLVRIPVHLSYEMISAWLWDINHRIDMIEWNLEALRESSVEDPVMRAFPRRPGSCTNWGRVCPFHDFCTAWPNPLKRHSDVPIGFIRYWWDPRSKPSKTVIDLTKKGDSGEIHSA